MWRNIVRFQHFQRFSKPEGPPHDEFFARVSKNRRLLAGVGVIAAGVYYVSHLEKVPFTGRTRFMTMKEREEERLGEMMYQKLLVTHGAHILPGNHPYSIRVSEVAKRLVASSPLSNKPWTFHVIDNPQANCFVIPGQHVFVFTGILPIFQDEDGMAAVLGHEIGHQIARHSAEKLTLYKGLVLLEILVSTIFDIPKFFQRTLFNLAIDLPFSRKCETEADHIGVLLMAKACYNPEAAVGVFERLAKYSEKSTSRMSSYLSTHPASASRALKIKEWLPEARALRSKHCDEFWDAFKYSQQ